MRTKRKAFPGALVRCRRTWLTATLALALGLASPSAAHAVGSISGTVTDSQGPVQGICVSHNGSTFNTPQTAADGTYTITGVAPGTYKVVFFPCFFPGPSPGTADLLWEYYDDKPNVETANDVVVVDGANTPNINALLARGGKIMGRISDSSGAALEGACAFASPTVPVTGPPGLPSATAASDQTDAQGDYELKGLRTGDYRVEFSSCDAGSYLSEYYDDKPNAQAADLVSVTAEQTTAGVNAALTAGAGISGRVTDSSGSPLQGLCVAAYGTDQPAPVVTNANGEYAFDSLHAGDYVVEFVSTGNGCGITTSSYLREYYDDKRSFRTATKVTLSAGESEVGIDAALTLGGKITGRVTDSAGNPVQGVCVNATAASDGQSGPAGAFFDPPRTNANGEYTVVGLRSGNYTLRFSGPCFPNPSPPNVVSEFYNDQFAASLADPVAVTVGQTTSGIDAELQIGGRITGRVTDEGGMPVASVCAIASGGGFQASDSTDSNGDYTIQGLPAGSYKISFASCSPFGGQNLAPESYPDRVEVAAGQTVTGIDASLAAGGGISGRVTDEAGAGLAGVCVDALSAGIARASTNSNGEYALTGLQAGEYKLIFRPCPGPPPNADVAVEYYEDASTEAEADPVAVTDGQTTTNIDATLAKGGVIRGRVTDSAGAPAGVCVMATRSRQRDASTVLTSTDANGEYAIRGLGAGSYRVFFGCSFGIGPPIFGGPSSSQPNLAPEFYDNASTFEAATPVVVSAGVATEDIDAVLAPGGTISGVVTDAGGDPVENACVDASGPGIDAPGVTDAAGYYEIRGLATGSYSVKFRTCAPTLGNFAFEYYDDEPLEATADAVNVQAGQTVPGIDAQLAPGGTIRGRVIDALSPDPPGSTCVAAYRATAQTGDDFEQDPLAETTTDQTGRYAIHGLRTGSYKLRFGGTCMPLSGFAFRSVGGYAIEYSGDEITLGSADAVAVTAGAATSGVDAELAGGGSIRGKVTGADGDLDGVCVAAVDPGSGILIQATTTGFGGRYEIFGIAPGTYKVKLFTRDCGRATRSGLETEFHENEATLANADAVSIAAGQTQVIDAAMAPDQAPDTVIDGGPDGPTNDRTPSFTFHSTEAAGATFQCQIDSLASSACNSGSFEAPELQDGSHTFRVTATDAAGNADGSPAQRSFTVDATGPSVQITSGPSGTTSASSGAISFSAEGGTTFRCRLDGEAFQLCTSPRSFTGLGPGGHSFAVKALDSLGNEGPEATRSWTVDTGSSTETTSGAVPAGGTLSSDPGGAGATPLNPLTTAVQTPVAGDVSIIESSGVGPSPSGYSFFGQQVEISAPPASASAPLRIAFRLDGSLIPDGTDVQAIEVFRNGAVVGDCTGTIADPDPCVLTRGVVGDGDVELVVLTSQASTWNFGKTAAAEPNPDKTLRAEFSAAKAQRLSKLRVFVTCPDEACLGAAAGTITVTPRRRPGDAAKPRQFKLPLVLRQITAGGQGVIRLTLKPKAAKQASALLAAGAKGVAAIGTAAADAAGNLQFGGVKVRVTR